eukprot:scaffold278537_cov31-Tisochrysis_lutea.AAC.2
MQQPGRSVDLESALAVAPLEARDIALVRAVEVYPVRGVVSGCVREPNGDVAFLISGGDDELLIMTGLR